MNLPGNNAFCIDESGLENHIFLANPSSPDNPTWNTGN